VFQLDESLKTKCRVGKEDLNFLRNFHWHLLLLWRVT
jgi:hypothetical protein